MMSAGGDDMDDSDHRNLLPASYRDCRSDDVFQSDIIVLVGRVTLADVPYISEWDRRIQ
jgi:hypothetical protein